MLSLMSCIFATKGREAMAKDTQLAMLKLGVTQWNEWRLWSQSHFLVVSIDLTDADLRGAALAGARLRNANLRNATLAGANLTDADLSGADLRDADLSHCKLTDTNLRGANLRNADLSAASLNGANLADADLGGAILAGAQLRSVDLRNANLRYVAVTDAAGRLNVAIIGTCFVDEATMRRSEGCVPEAFLRACGAASSLLTLLAPDFRQRNAP